ncbi:MAG TPA: FtsX-like permease family protein [Gemmataceae bacterium]|nr:FtsX-like permease family protein [Gemmataceae bacterium]
MQTFAVSPRLLGMVGFFALLLVALAFLGRVPLKYNLRNLVVRWRVTVLTALVFAVVAALLTVMMAFVNGMYRLTQGSAQPGNVIVLSDGATDELFSNLAYGDTSDLERDPPNVLRDEEGRPLASWELYIVVNQPIPESSPLHRKGHHRRFLQLRGIKDPVLSARVHGLQLHPGGSWFSRAGVRDDPDGGKDQVIEVLLGEGIARAMGTDVGKPSLAVGDTFELGPRRWVVSGILTSAGTTFDSEIWAERQLAGEKFGKELGYTTLVLRTADAEKAKETATWLTTNFKKSAVMAQTETEYYEKLNETNKQFLVVFVIVAVFMAVGGVFGVMNTMFAAISQRIKDIGVLRILGFARWQLLLSFFLETLLIALIGGLIGLAVGSLANGWSMTSIAGSGMGGGKSVVFKLTVDLNIWLGVLTFILGMGIVGGLLPALSAMRLKALESLR